MNTTTTFFNSIIKYFFTIAMVLTPLFAQNDSQMTFIEGNVIACNGCLGGPIGCPIPGANIDAVPLNSSTDEAYSTHGDENGHFALEVPVGAYSITCSQTGWDSQTQTLEVGYNGSVIEFCLTEVQATEVFFNGYVYGNYYPDQNNAEPLSGAVVTVGVSNSPTGEIFTFVTETNENGYFVFDYFDFSDELTYISFFAHVHAEGYHDGEMTFEYNGAPITHNFFLNPFTEPTDVLFSGTVSGSFSDWLPAYEPLEGALVEVFTGTASGIYDVLFETETNHEGYFQFLNDANTVFPEEAQVRVSKDGYQTVEEWLDFHELPVTHDFYLNHINDPYPTTVVFGHVSGQLSPMGPTFPIGGAEIGVTPSSGDPVMYFTETNENGWYELELEDSTIGNMEWMIYCTTEFGVQTETFFALPGQENEVNFHFNSWDEPVISAPYDLTVELIQDASQWEHIAILDWEYQSEDNTMLPVFNIYAQYGGPYGQFIHAATSDQTHFEMMIGGFIGYNGCFYVTATLNGTESEPSNIACGQPDDPTPPAPVGLNAEYHENEQVVELEWGYIADYPFPVTFNVYMAFNYSNFTLIGETDAFHFIHEISLPGSNVDWEACYKVTAVVGSNESAPSNVDCTGENSNPNTPLPPHDLTLELEPQGISTLVHLNWNYDWDYDPDPSTDLPTFLIYANYGLNSEWTVVGESHELSYTYTIGDFWYPEELCFYVTAVDGGAESEPSNTACIHNVDPDPVCEDLSGISFGNCEMIIGIGWNGEECTWYSGCGTTSDDGVDYSNAFFDSVEACEEVCGVDDDGPPECILDCPGIEEIDPDENADGACEWIIDTVSNDSECISDCDEYTFELLSEVSWACEMCLAGEFECEDIFNDEDPNETGIIFGMVEYVWGDAIELVAGAHIVVTGLSNNGTVEDVYETETNEQGMYELEVPAGAYIVTATAYEETESIEAIVEPGHEVQVNFQFGEFYWPTALTGMVYGELEIPEPLDDAHIILHSENGENWETWTTDGWYWLDLPGVGEFSITIEAEGYFTEDFTFFIDGGVIDMDFYLTPMDDYMEPEAILSLGDGLGGPNGFTVPLYLNSQQPVSGLQFQVGTEVESWEYYFIPGELEVMDDCFSGNANDVYGQLWGIIFSLEGCVYEANENHHVANLSFTIEGEVPAGTEVPLYFSYTLVSNPDAVEVSSEGVGSVVTFGLQGDVNSDGEINVMDIVQLINFILVIDEPTDFEFWAGDVNADGALNVIDVVQIVNIILYDDAMGSNGRTDSGEALLQYNSNSIYLNGHNIVGFQIEFDGELSQPQLPNGWEFASSQHTAIAYNVSGEPINSVEMNFSGDITSAIVVDAQGQSIPVLMDEIPNATALYDAYPNPFNPTTTIGFNVEVHNSVTLQIFNLQGQLVETLVNGVVDEGYHEVQWDASQLSSGVYLIHMITPNQVFTQKLMLVK